MSFSDVGSTMSARPDRPLIVKATFDRYNKRITFSSARNCSYDLLRRKVEQSFSLQAFSFSIAYKDDDGEVTDITSEADLTEAIEYFQAGVDDPPVSSAASILSGRSFGSRRITLRVNITVDYDGPSLSDTSSLVSLDEYRNKRSSESSFSLSFSGASGFEPEDDSVTVSSRDTGLVQSQTSLRSRSGLGLVNNGSTVHDFQSSSSLENGSIAENPFEDRYPADPSAVFERLKLSESSESLERNTQWLRDQNTRTIHGIIPPESVSDGSSLDLEDFEAHSPFDGDLALQQDNGKFYYTYTSAASSATQDDISISDSENSGNRLNFMDSQQTLNKSLQHRASTSSHPSSFASSSDPLIRASLSVNGSGTSSDAYQFSQESFLPPGLCTDCSDCGILLDTMRYVCSTCGEKTPKRPESITSYRGKGKSRDDPFSDTFAYPPPSHRAPGKPLPSRPLPTLPSGHRVVSSKSSTGSGSSSSITLAGDGGFELCPNCIETAGVIHALIGASPDAADEPSSPQDAQKTLSQLRRTAPRQKGHFRHAYIEKLWGASGWKDVEQDIEGECTICNTALVGQRYKCASCTKFILCRACYSQVHEIHPSHAFLDIPDKPAESPSEPELRHLDHLNDDVSEDESLTHPDVKCSHCLMDIVGARFHCAICESVDICSNCEAAGLPGNIDADEGGHNSSHIMIKIPIPLNSNKVQIASRRARQLWTGRDAPNVQRTPSGRTRSDSFADGDAVTVIGSLSKSRRSKLDSKSLDHHILCSGCKLNIEGVRFQCATCPSTKSHSYSLCSKCEQRSYLIHDPMHIFFKLPRPVNRHIVSTDPVLPILYRAPAGPLNGFLNSDHPKAYLKTLHHTAALCDNCMERISGEWFRCVYCAKDYCDVCENLNVHDPLHFFYVFKAPVDMQIFRIVAELDNPAGSPPVIDYPVYHQ